MLHLLFNGYTASSGQALLQADLTAEAIRLTRLLRRVLPGQGEVAGAARADAAHQRAPGCPTGPDGRAIPLAEQDRDLWDAAAIAEGQAILTATLGAGPVGPYQF